MRRFDDDGDAERRDLLADRIGDFAGQSLLYLEAAAEYVDEPRNLAETNHLGGRNVGDVALAEKRQQVTLAERQTCGWQSSRETAGILTPRESWDACATTIHKAP